MKMTILFAAAGMLALGSTALAIDPEAFSWPAATKEAQPWTRWWWLGSAVDNANTTKLLEQYHAAGIGGVEICPIYGAKGYESRYLPFLSKQWLGALAHTTKEAERLGMGVDLTTGTGWPFGGPQVTKDLASSKVTLKKNGEGKYEVVVTSAIQKVKRAAPGGEGYVVDPYSPGAMRKYLVPFEAAMKDLGAPLPRAQFHDSFEYYGANWTPSFFADFKRLRGYDLQQHLAELAGDGEQENVARVKHDYRETIADLHLEYLAKWVNFAHEFHGLARNQAHGSPTNLLDAYAIADIPETEMNFGAGNHVDNSPVFLKFASSAAHVSGRPLASSESFTWLGEHFQVSLADCKPAADLLFVSGINHIFFHGTPYSPEDVAWPGWLFYASVNFGPQGGLFHDLPAFTGYLTRVQSVLQAGRADNDVLLYWPIHDVWMDEAGMLKPLTVHDQAKWLYPTAFFKMAEEMVNRGVTFDAVSDRLLAGAKMARGKVVVNGGAYRAVVVPGAKFMTVETARKLAEIKAAGGTVLFTGQVPGDVPGWLDADRRRGELKEYVSKFEVAGDLSMLPGEAMADLGLRFARRTNSRGRNYFISNPTAKSVDGWVPLDGTVASAVLMDPMVEDHVGSAAVRHRDGKAEVYLQLGAGASTVLRTFEKEQVSGPAWEYVTGAGQPTDIEGTWHVTFVDGGPVLPRAFETNKLASWTRQEDPEAKRFAGTGKYTIDFDGPAQEADDYVLDLGKVAESARVRLNGQDLGTVWCAPYCVRLGKALKTSNHLEVEVTNLAANRIADLDRRGVQWKAFHEINFVNKAYKPFDASGWEPRDSGLIGPVKLVPLKAIQPGEEK